MFDPITILSALLPVIVRAGNSLVQRFAPDQVKPTSVEDVAKLQALEIERFRILQEADKGGTTYQWVEAIRKLQRPAVVALLAGAFFWYPDNQVVVDMFAVVTFYLFGERVPLRVGK